MIMVNSFVAVWLTSEKPETILPEETIVRKPNHPDFPTHRCGNLSQIAEIAKRRFMRCRLTDLVS